MALTLKEDNQSSNINNSPPLFSGGLLAQNTFLNLVGQALPMLVAFIAMPFIINGLGVDRFGVLTLAWMMIGYFSLFNMGLGRATTKFISEYLAKGEHDKLSELIWASILMLIGFGIVGSVIAILITPWLINDILNIPPDLIEESTTTFYLLGLSVPIVLGIAGVRGVLEAFQKFYIINAVKVPTYIAAFVTPLLVLPFTNNLVPVVILLIASRLAGLIAFIYHCFKVLPDLKKFKFPGVNFYKKLLGYGGWLTISNIIWPMMNYLDRFIIGAVLTMGAVAYYVTPYELVTKLLIISGSLLSVIFPAFSAFSTGEHNKLMNLHTKAVKYLLLALVPVVFIMIALAYPFFNIWLGADFAQNSSTILQLLALGILINSVSQVPSSAIQAMGRPDITAKLHLIELPIYLAMLWYFIDAFGIVGAALAWVIRIVIDTTLYFYLFYRLTPVEHEKREYPKFSLLIATGLMMCIAFLINYIENVYLQVGSVILLTLTFLYFGWKRVLIKEETVFFIEMTSKMFKRSTTQ